MMDRELKSVVGLPGQEIEEALFAAALALPVSERRFYLQRACSGNIQLHSHLTALIDAFVDAEDFSAAQRMCRDRGWVLQGECVGVERKGEVLSADQLGAMMERRESVVH